MYKISPCAIGQMSALWKDNAKGIPLEIDVLIENDWVSMEQMAMIICHNRSGGTVAKPRNKHRKIQKVEISNRVLKRDKRWQFYQPVYKAWCLQDCV